MNDNTVIEAVTPQETAKKRLPYRPPALQTFGQVSMLTQGASIGANGDGGQGMMVAKA